MKIIISNYFMKTFNKIFPYSSIKLLINKININSKNFIGLKYPFFKVKLKIDNKTYRLILFSDANFLKIIFINIFDKKDKKFGENISWNVSSKDIINHYKLNLDDIEKGNYKVYR